MSEAIASAAPTAPARSPGWIAKFGVWAAAAGLLLLLPLIFRSGTALTMMSLMGIGIVFALSYNILLGQTGMLSFGPAVYYGLGAYFTVHAINLATDAGIPIPLPAMPLAGAAAGLVFAILFGWVSTKRSGTAFAMISLGLAELVGSSSLILRSFFGGEEGVTTNRTKLIPVFGATFGPQIEVYYLIAAWCIVAAAAMYFLTRTPFGRMCNAVRDNPQRVAFVGYNPRTVRFLAFCFSGLFSGLAGGLAGINFELANSALFGAAQSGQVLLATYIGGAGYFAGPVLGAALVAYLQTMLSDITPVWQLYFGLLFIATVMFAPGGIAGLIAMHRKVLRPRAIVQLLPVYIVTLAAAFLVAAGVIVMIEMLAHLAIKASEGSTVTMLGQTLDIKSAAPWISAAVAIASGCILLKALSGPLASRWERASGSGLSEVGPV